MKKRIFGIRLVSWYFKDILYINDSYIEQWKNPFNVVICHDVSVMRAIFLAPHLFSFIFTPTRTCRMAEWLSDSRNTKYIKIDVILISLLKQKSGKIFSKVVTCKKYKFVTLKQRTISCKVRTEEIRTYV